MTLPNVQDKVPIYGMWRQPVETAGYSPSRQLTLANTRLFLSDRKVYMYIRPDL